MTFDLWSVAEDDTKLPVGGDELKNISCLLPRKSKMGKLYPGMILSTFREKELTNPLLQLLSLLLIT